MLPSFWRSLSPPAWVYLPWRWLGRCWPLYSDVSWIRHQEAEDWGDTAWENREEDIRFKNKSTGNCTAKLSHQRADVPKKHPRWRKIYGSNFLSCTHHYTECVNSCLIQLGEAAKAFPAVWESICMWLEQRILAWLTTLSHRLLVVNNKACALEKEHAEKDKSAELIACTQAHTESLSLSSFLPLPPLGFLRQVWSSCWPGHVTSAELDQHETLLAGDRGGGGGAFTPGPCLSKDMPWDKN